MRDNDKVMLADVGDSKERRAFTPSELIECNACGRSNPPTRHNCLYCGAALKTHGRSFDPHAVIPAAESGLEKSFTVVALAKGDAVEESALGRAADLVALSTPDLRAVTSATRGAPFYCTNTAEQAEVVRERIRELAIPTITISDDELNLDKPVLELRSLEFTDDLLQAVLRPGAGQVSARWEDVELLVLGRVQMTTFEVEQKRNRRQTHLIEEREMTTVEPVLDLYLEGINEGWRIRSGNFDFSCLGKDKAITAFENFVALVEVLRRRAGNAEFDDSFLRLRSVLNKVWPVEEGCVKTENRRTAMRQYEARVVSSDNEAQFTRYSRLLQVLKMRQLENN